MKCIIESFPIPEALVDAASVAVLDWTGVDAGFESRDVVTDDIVDVVVGRRLLVWTSGRKIVLRWRLDDARARVGARVGARAGARAGACVRAERKAGGVSDRLCSTGDRHHIARGGHLAALIATVVLVPGIIRADDLAYISSTLIADPIDPISRAGVRLGFLNCLCLDSCSLLSSLILLKTLRCVTILNPDTAKIRIRCPEESTRRTEEVIVNFPVVLLAVAVSAVLFDFQCRA